MEKFLLIIKRCIPRKIFKFMQPIYHFLLAWLSAAIYHFPSEKMIVIGVTGTTGKTTSVYLIAKTLEAAGYKVGYTSTAMFNNGLREWLNDKKVTMIGRFFTQKILRDMSRNGCEFAIIETTSEGIAQYRHRFINYDILVFTCLYPEHIESHGSFDAYKRAKGKLFAHLKECKIKYADENKNIRGSSTGIKKLDLNRVRKTIIINGDDEHSGYFLNFWAERKIVFTSKGNTDLFKEELGENGKLIKYGNIEASDRGTGFIVEGDKIDLQLLGLFNALNAMTAYCVSLSQEIKKEKIKSGLKSIKGVAGRLEKIDEGQNYAVIVDYAFEPNAVKKLYETINLIPHNKVIHVLGSTGGGRDIARRPILGELAGKNADYVIVTNEDPYDDDPKIIIDQVSFGAEKAGKKLNENLFKILDRREAIKKALSLAKEGDIVLITGKGSEQTICIAGGEKIPWDDRAVIRGLLS